MREDLITLKQARSAQPCSSGWTKFLKAIGEPAGFNPDRLFSVGDVALSNGLDDALWCLQLLPPKLAVMAVMPSVRRASGHTTDTRVHETISAVQRWIDGDTTVDLRTAALAAGSSRWAALAAVVAADAADAAARSASAADAAGWAALAAARAVNAVAAEDAAARAAQLQDILSRFPPYALA